MMPPGLWISNDFKDKSLTVPILNRSINLISHFEYLKVTEVTNVTYSLMYLVSPLQDKSNIQKHPLIKTWSEKKISFPWLIIAASYTFWLYVTVKSSKSQSGSNLILTSRKQTNLCNATGSGSLLIPYSALGQRFFLTMSPASLCRDFSCCCWCCLL